MNDSPSMDQVFIKKLTEIVLANITDERFSVEKLAKEAGMSRANLYRRLRSIKNQDVSKFIREVRLQRAMEMLRNKEGTAAEISYRVGFGSPAYFNKCFHEYFGFTPGEVKRQESVTFEGNQASELILFPGQNKLLKPKESQVHGRRQSEYRNTWILLAGTLSGLLLLGLFYILFLHNPQKKSIIVLPFKNLSSELETEHFAAGITEDILNHLFHISDLSVRSRTTSDYIGDQNLSIREIARQENIRYVLEGSVSRYGDKVIIFVQLIDAHKDDHVWSDKFDLEFASFIGIQGDIALQVAHELKAKITENEISRIEEIQTRSPEAYDYYKRGRFFLHKAYGNQRIDIDKEGLLGSLQNFEKAIAIDKNFADAYAGLANAYFNITAWGWLPPAEGGFLKAWQLSDQALKIDPDCAEAHAVKGALHIWGERKIEEGRKELLLALQLNPHFPPVHQWYAQLLMITGPIEEARIHMDRALEIEPYFWVLHNLNAWIYYFEEKYDNALDACKIAKDLKSDYLITNWLLFLNYAKLGEGVKAASELQTIVRYNSSTSQYVEEVMDYYNKSGIEGLFAWLIEININNPFRGIGLSGQPFFIAWWEAILGNSEESIFWLERNMEEKNRNYTFFNLIALNPDFDSLRNDPRFLSIIEQIGLTPYHTRAAK